MPGQGRVARRGRGRAGRGAGPALGVSGVFPEMGLRGARTVFLPPTVPCQEGGPVLFQVGKPLVAKGWSDRKCAPETLSHTQQVSWPLGVHSPSAKGLWVRSGA